MFTVTIDMKGTSQLYGWTNRRAALPGLQNDDDDFLSLSCSLFKTETHKPNHHLEPVYQPETFLDRDYCLAQSTGYNYLDPNYFPANR